MLILVDGNEVECEEIKIEFPENIVGCDCAGGSHREINGHHEITVDKDGIYIDQISEVEKCNESCYMMFDDLMGEMDKSIIVRKNGDEISYIRNLFHKI